MKPKTSLLNLYRVLATLETFIIASAFFGSIYLLFYGGIVFSPIVLVGVGVFVVILVIASVLSMVIISKSYHNELLFQGKYTKDEYLRSLLDSSAMYVIRTDMQGNYTYTNRSFLETFVAPEHRAAIVGISTMNYIIPEDHAATIRVVEQCLAEPRESVFIRLRKPRWNGTILTTEWEFKTILHDGVVQELQCTGIDVTERQHLYEKVEKEHSTLDNLVASINGIVWEADANTFQFTYISPSAEPMLGYATEEWLQDLNFWANHIYEEDREKTVQSCIAYSQALQNHDLKYRFVKANGEVVWMRDIITVESREGKPTTLKGVMVDISERMSLEQELRKSEAQLQLAIEGSSAGLWDWYVQSGVTVFNEQWAHIIGYSLEELEPVSIETWTKFGHPEDVQRSGELLQAHFRGETPFYECEARMFHKSGSIVWVLDRGKVVEWNKDGTPHRMTGTHLDITERKRADGIIKKSQNNLKIAQHLAKIGSWEWDIVIDSITWSEEQYRLFGETPETFQTTYEGYLSHLSQEEREITNNLITEALEGKAQYQIEHEIIRKDGTTFFAIEQGEVVRDQSGTPIRIYGTTQDITERKVAEERIQHSEAKLRAVFDASVQSHFLIDSSYRIQLWNKNAAKHVRQVFEREIRLGDDMRHSILQDHRETFEQNFQLALQGISSRFEKAVQLPFRAFAHRYEYQYIPVRDSSGEIISVSFSALDITEQQNAAEQLAQSEQRYRSFVELQGTYFVRTDLAGRYTYASPSMLKDYMKVDESVIGTSGLEHIIPEDHDIVRNTIERCLQAPNTPVHVILRKPHVSGRVFTTDWEFIAVTNSEGIPAEIQCVGYDITDRVQAEALLAASEEKYRSMVHNIGDIITLLDAEGNILYESSSIGTILGWSETDLVGKSMFEYLHPDDIAMVQERFGNMLLHDIVENTEFRYRNGSKINGCFDRLSMRYEALFSLSLSKAKRPFVF